MTLQTLALIVVGLVGSSCGNRPQAGSPVGTWVIVDDSTRAAEFVTVSRAQSIRDVTAPGTGGITLRLDGITLRDQTARRLSSLRYIHGLYSMGRGGRPSQILLTDSSEVDLPQDVYLDLTDPDSVFAVFDFYMPPVVDYLRHVPSWSAPLPPFLVGSDSAVFWDARFTFRQFYYNTRTVGRESSITANGTLAFARRPLAANRETQFGDGYVGWRPWTYSMRFNPDGAVQIYGANYWHGDLWSTAARSGRWTRTGPSEIRVDLGGGIVSTYRLTVDRWARTMTVVEDTECDQRCRAFFARLLDVEPGTLLNIRTERTRIYRWEEDARPDSLPQPRPPDYVI